VITLTLSADGHDGGMLQQLVKSCRGSLSTAYRWLPRQSWLVIGERAATHSGTTSGATAALLQAGLPELVTLPAKKVLSRFLGQTLPALTRDYALALHAPASGGGIALTLVAHVSDPQATTRQLQRAADRLQHWAVANREGRLFALPLARTPDAKEAYVRAIWGADLALGWSVVGSTALLCVGKGAAERLQQLSRQLAAGTAPANALSSHPAFKQVLAQAGRRSGLLYVVPEGLLQALQKTGIPELEQLQTPPSASSAQGATTETPTTSAPYLLWGAAADGETYEVTLYLPIAPLSRFQDALRALAQGTTAARSSSTTKRFRR